MVDRQAEDCSSGRLDTQTHKALLMRSNHAVLNPEAPAAHHVGHHHVGGQSIAYNGNLRGMRHARFWMLLKVLHDF